jgi:CarD family transcriptional regulator
VYAAYGLGRVAARKTAIVQGVKQEMVVLEFEDGLTVSLPVERAQEQLRALASEAEIGRVQKTLREDRGVSTDPWLSRQRDARAKLSGGDPLELAEIVRDGAARERSLVAKGAKSQLSPGERDIFVKARRLLSSEIAQVRGLGADEADDWIDLQLTSS